jgi:hypothetical protein
MNRIGISFKSSLSPDEILARFIRPLRAALEPDRAGFYSNYLRQAEADPAAPDEHLLIFQVHDFQASLHLLRMKIEEIGPPPNVLFHNLDPSEPLY